jgi:putative transposase
VKRARCAPTREQIAKLVALTADREANSGLARRAQVILLSSEGVSGVAIAARLKLSNGQVSRIRARFLLEGVEGLSERPRRGRTDHAVSERVVESVLALAVSAPPAGHRRWSTRLIGARVGLTSATVSKILRSRLGGSAESQAGAVRRSSTPRTNPRITQDI